MTNRGAAILAFFAIQFLGCGAPGGVAPPASPAPADADCPTQPSDLYDQRPGWKADAMGFFETGVAIVDVNGDGWGDLVVSNGNDMSPQPIAVFLNRGRGASGAPFGRRPDWYSEDIDYHGGLAAGDIDGDSCPDIAVSVILGRSLEVAGGHVKIYLNRGPDSRTGQCLGLEPVPRQITSSGYSTVSCALGDADADGDLDLAVAVASEAAVVIDRTITRVDATQVPPGYSLLYENDGGTIATEPTWRSAIPMRAADVRFHDVDRDGLLDVVFAASRTAVYYGRAEGGRVAIETAPGWQSADEEDLSYSIDAGRVGTDGATGIAVSATSLRRDAGLQHFKLYLPERGRPASTAPSWHSSSAGRGSRLLLADVDGDARLDLIAGRWSETEKQAGGAVVRIFSGTDRDLAAEPSYCSGQPIVAQGIAAGNVLTLPVARHYSARVRTRAAVVTLPDQLLERVESIAVNGAPLPRNAYAFVPGQPWISLSRRLTAGDAVDVAYRVADSPDLAVADWDCSGPLVLYYGRSRRLERRS